MAGNWRSWLSEEPSGLIGKLLFEVAIIFVGVTAAFAVDNYRQNSAENAYREQIIQALIPTLNDVLRHNRKFDALVDDKLAAFDAALVRGERLPLPYYREDRSERPPVRAWDGIVATGASRALDPALLFKLAQFYTRQESAGERYIRYNDFTESRVFAMGADQNAAWDGAGRLKPEFAAWIDRLRDLKELNGHLTKQSLELRAELLARH